MKIDVFKTDKLQLKNILASKGLHFFELVDCVSGKKIENRAKVALLWDDEFLYVYFIVKDKHIWGTYKNDNEPIYNEEVVEVFIAFGNEVPKHYLETQFSPNKVKFTANISNPTGNRHDKDFKIEFTNIAGLEFTQEIIKDGGKEIAPAGEWKTFIKIPAKVIKGSEFKTGDRLRAGFFRIDGYPKQDSFQAVLANFEKPANFHVPSRFLTLNLK